MHKRLIEIEGALEASLQGRQEGLISQPTQVPLTLGTAPPMVTTSVPPIDTTTAAAPASASASTSTTIPAAPTAAAGQ